MNCWLADLPDFKQEDPETAAELLTWIAFIVKEYEIDGLRMDTCLHVPKWFLKKVNEKAGVYMACEANNGDVMVNAPFQGAGIDATLNIPFLWGVRNTLVHDYGFDALRDIWTKGESAYKDQFLLGNSLENHDNPRFLYECAQAEEGKQWDQRPEDKDPSEICMARFRNAIVAQFLWPGIPMTYYGGEFGFRGGRDPENREPLTVDMQKNDPQGLQRLFKVMAATRSARVAAGGFKDMFLTDSKDAWCWGRETGGESDVLTCITHAKTTREFKVPVNGLFSGYKGKICNVVSTEEECQELGGEISVAMKKGEAVVFLTQSRAKEVIQKTSGGQKTAAFLNLF